MKTTDLLNKVKKDYNDIADEFSVTRNRPWHEFELFKQYVDEAGLSARILDVGCGNGRLACALKHSQYIGIDNSRKLLKLAREKNPTFSFKYGDILKIPFQNHSFEIVFAVAVLHHIPSRALQLVALKELKRVTKLGGKVIITVWNLWQRKYEKYIDKATHESFIPWGVYKKTERYYHAFTSEEIEELIRKSGFAILKKVTLGTDNCDANNFVFVCVEKGCSPVAGR